MKTHTQAKTKGGLQQIAEIERWKQRWKQREKKGLTGKDLGSEMYVNQPRAHTHSPSHSGLNCVIWGHIWLWPKEGLTLTLHHTKAKNKTSSRLKFLPTRQKTPLFCSPAIFPFFGFLDLRGECPKSPVETWLRSSTRLLGPVRLGRGACLLQPDV